MLKRRGFLKNSLLLTAGATYYSDLISAEKFENQPEAKTVSLKKKLPIQYTADVVIIGGGMAGVSAACAAASTGTSVILIERFGALGGMFTTGGVANFCGQMDKQGEVLDEVLYELKRFNSLGEGNRPSVFNYEILFIVPNIYYIWDKIIYNAYFEANRKEDQVFAGGYDTVYK